MKYIDPELAFDLDAVGALEGTDKSSSVAWAWDYLRHYQEHFAPWRELPINFIEIGVAGGPSLNVWRAFFTQAHIIGVDIEPKCRHLARERVTIEIGSQYDADFMRGVCAKYPPSIVIDDGSHLAHHIVFTFELVFPALLPGGLYVVEDTEFQFPMHGKRWQGDGSVSVADYFAALARDRMGNGFESRQFAGARKQIAEQIDSITFIGGSIILRKRRPRDVPAGIAFAQAYLEAGPRQPERYRRLADFILRHEGPLDLAHAAAQQGMAGQASHAAPFKTLARVLERQARFGEAAEVVGRAARLWPDQAELWQLLARMHKCAGEAGAAADSLRQGLAANPKLAALYRDLVEILEQSGDLPGALAVATEASEACGDSHDYSYFLGRAGRIRKQIEAGVA